MSSIGTTLLPYLCENIYRLYIDRYFKRLLVHRQCMYYRAHFTSYVEYNVGGEPIDVIRTIPDSGVLLINFLMINF